MRPIILVFTQCYLPGYRAGGPVRTIANLVERLGDEFDFRIVCADREFKGENAYAGVKVDAWNKVGKAEVFYASERTRSLCGWRQLLRETPHDVLYLNSFFSPVFTVYPLLLRVLGLAPRVPALVAPRGEFSTGALALKPLRKRVYIAVARVIRLYTGAHWQASSTHEAHDIARGFAIADRMIREARDLVAPPLCGIVSGESPERVQRTCARSPSLRICFLSRIAPMKNLEFALRVLARVTVPVQFSIYGTVEDTAYWSRCQEVAKTVPRNIEVVYEGVVHPSEVVATLTRHDLFLFPTRGENFGHVIHEALRAGLPLLISDRTPWEDLESRGVGWDLSLDDPDAFAARIEQVAGFSAEEHEQWSSRARAFAAEIGGDTGVLDDNRRLFNDAIAGVVAAGAATSTGHESNNCVKSR